MDKRMKLYSEMERCEIININNGEKYDYLHNNDIIIDENGYLKSLVIDKNKPYFSFFRTNDFLEFPWECVNKISSKTIIIDADELDSKK